MKNYRLAVLVAALAMGVLILPHGGDRAAIADKTSTTLMNGQTTNGVGLASLTSAITPTEDSAGHWLFQFACRDAASAASAACSVHLELSNDSGTTWSAIHRFTGSDEVYQFPTCGICSFRAIGDNLSTAFKATLIASQSGATGASAPTYTATSTPTLTQTPTRTPTVTPTRTITPTFTNTAKAATITPTFTPTAVHTSTPTNTPTLTPTLTLTPTPTGTWATMVPTVTRTPMPTLTPTRTATSRTPSPTPTATVTPSGTWSTATPTSTPTVTLTPTLTPTNKFVGP
jgi:hypothetical protein